MITVKHIFWIKYVPYPKTLESMNCSILYKSSLVEYLYGLLNCNAPVSEGLSPEHGLFYFNLPWNLFKSTSSYQKDFGVFFSTDNFSKACRTFNFTFNIF